MPALYIHGRAVCPDAGGVRTVSQAPNFANDPPVKCDEASSHCAGINEAPEGRWRDCCFRAHRMEATKEATFAWGGRGERNCMEFA